MTKENNIFVILEGMNKRIDDGFLSMERHMKTIEENNKDKINELRSCHVQHDKRICKLEASLSYQVGKIAAVSALIGGLVSIIIAIVR